MTRLGAEITGECRDSGKLVRAFVPAALIDADPRRAVLALNSIRPLQLERRRGRFEVSLDLSDGDGFDDVRRRFA